MKLPPRNPKPPLS